MDKVIIRKMTAADSSRVAEIEKDIFSSPWSEKSFLDAIQSEDNIYLTAVAGEEVIGYCGFWVSYETADLCNMAVAVPYRRQSVGQQLLTEGIRCLQQKDVQRILLEVRKSNEKAKKLYQKMGFACIGERKKYYSNPEEDAILMQKEI